MTTLGKTTRAGIVTVGMLIGITTGAKGQVAVGGIPFGGETRGIVQIKGKVVCVECGLDQARKARPGENHLYQLAHRRGQVVLEAGWVNESQRWSNFASPRIWLRGEDSLFEKLAAEENLFKEVEITGVLSHSGTLDVSRVMIRE